MSLVLKNFINNLFIMKSRDLSCDCLIGSTSRPYSKIGIHFVDIYIRLLIEAIRVFAVTSSLTGLLLLVPRPVERAERRG